MAKGGARLGAGRKLGVPNKNRAEFEMLLRNNNRVDILIEKLMELAIGAYAEKEAGGVKVVYQKPPDVHAITYLLDQAFGKPRQHLDTEISSELTWEQLFTGDESDEKK